MLSDAKIHRGIGFTQFRAQQEGEVVEGDELRGLTEEEAKSAVATAKPLIQAAKQHTLAEQRKAKRASRIARGPFMSVITSRRAASREASRFARPTLKLARAQGARKYAELAEW